MVVLGGGGGSYERGTPVLLHASKGQAEQLEPKQRVREGL